MADALTSAACCLFVFSLTSPQADATGDVTLRAEEPGIVRWPTGARFCFQKHPIWIRFSVKWVTEHTAEPSTYICSLLLQTNQCRKLAIVASSQITGLTLSSLSSLKF